MVQSSRVPLQDTDEPHSRAISDPVSATHDHMGRRHVNTVGEAFAQDWPYILGVIGVLVFIVMAMAGYFR